MLAVLVAGCTQATIYQADGTVQIRNGFGVMNVATQPGKQPQLIQMNGLGFVSRNGAVTIGIFSEETALLPMDDCRIVIWIDKNTTTEIVDEITALGNSVCRVGPGAQQAQQQRGKK